MISFSRHLKLNVEVMTRGRAFGVFWFGTDATPYSLRIISARYLSYSKLLFAKVVGALVMLYGLSAYAATPIFTSFCGVIEYRSDLLDKTRIPSQTDYEKCMEWKYQKSARPISVEINFDGIDTVKFTEIIFDHRKSSTPGFMPAFVGYKKAAGEYYFDWSKFTDAYNDWPRYQRNAEIMHADGQSRRTSVNFHHRKTPRGDLVVCEISYVNDDKTIEWKEAYFNFDSAGKISVWYWSPLMSKKDIFGFQTLDRMKELFFSMRYSGLQ